MKKSLQMLLGAVAFATASLGMVGEAGATSWGAWAPTRSQAVTSNHATHTVTIQASVFTTSVWATVNSNNGPFTNLAQLNSSDGGAQAAQVNGTNTLNGNLVFFTPLFTTVVSGLGVIQSN